MSNTGNNTLSRYTVGPNDRVVLSDERAAITSGGPTDLALSGDGHFLYNENGLTGRIETYRIGTHGALSFVGFVGGLTPQVAEGLAAS